MDSNSHNLRPASTEVHATIDDDGKCKFRIIPNDADDKSAKANLLCVGRLVAALLNIDVS